jgi:CHAD domain-containing protein/CYTH domain-containing protein
MTTSHPSIAALPVRIGIRLLALAYLDEAESARQRMVGGRDAEALHDFRVALRRLRSCLRAYRPFFADTVRGRDRRAVREVAAATGAARDLEVQVAWLAGASLLPRDAAAGARLLLKRLRQAGRLANREALRSAHRLPALRDQVAPGLARYCEEIDRNHPLRTVTCAGAAAELAGPAIDELEAALGRIGPDGDSTAIHETRIAGKRIRYLFEPYRDAAPGGAALLRQLRRFQDQMGELHDLDVLLGLAREPQPGPNPGDSAPGVALEALAAHIEAARKKAFQRARRAWLRRTQGDLAARARAFAGSLRPAAGQEASTEIERKYLLRSLPRMPDGTVVLRIDQGYIPGERLVERLRRIRGPEGTRYYRTVKLGTGIRRTEVVEETDAPTFRALWRLTRGHRLRKRRYLAPDGDRKWEIDRFLDRSLVLAEIELPDENADVIVPRWLEPRIVREVTGEPEFLNVNLAG